MRPYFWTIALTCGCGARSLLYELPVDGGASGVDGPSDGDGPTDDGDDGPTDGDGPTDDDGADGWYDAGPDADTDADCDDEAAPNCIDCDDPEIPPISDIGVDCRDNRDCQLGFFCVPDANGWPDGYCLAGGPEGGGGCDLALPASCPEGSHCLFGGVDADGARHFYCFKDCAITDRNPWDRSSCGCRAGYECDVLAKYCVPGCTAASLEEDCCAYWADPNGNFIFDGSSEYETVPGCVLTCNEEAFRCSNPGSAGASWGDPCTFNQDCPAEGTCLQEKDADSDPDTPQHRFIGGYCTRRGCDLGGRECDSDCRSVTEADTTGWLCVKSCSLSEGGDPLATSPTCGDDYSCWPDYADPDAVQNGYCWSPPRYSAVRDAMTIGAACDDVTDCYSPYGQGLCLSEDDGWIGGACAFEACDFGGMEGLCPVATHVCEPLDGRSYCIDRCTNPGEGFGIAVGCRSDDYACYQSAEADPVGVCLPNCGAQPDPDQFCASFFVGAPNCDLASGTCE